MAVMGVAYEAEAKKLTGRLAIKQPSATIG